MLGLELLHILLELLGLLPLAAEIADHLLDATTHARVEVDLRSCAQCTAGAGIAEIGERAHHVDAQDGVGVVEQILEVLARTAIGRQLRNGERSGAPHARRVPIARPRIEMRQRAIVTQRRKAVDGARRDDVGP